MESEPAHFTYVFKALSDTTRLQILTLLRGHKEMTVTDIASHFNLAQPTISQHLKILTDSGVLKMRKEGQRVFYHICSIKIYDAMGTFLEVYKEQAEASRRHA
jgi:ArsR family transcriptional regulator, arsenate/arsenite/antimonite-responsive transcriptional repressor